MPLSGRKGWGGGGNNTSIAVAANPCCRTTAHCHSSLATALIEHDSGAGGTRSARGAKGLPPLQRRGHLLTCGPSTQPLQLLLSDSSNRTQSRCQGNNERTGGRRAARAATPRPSVGAQAIDTASATPPQRQPRPNTNAVPGGQQVGGGDEGPPAQQRSQHHPSTHGPSMRH